MAERQEKQEVASEEWIKVQRSVFAELVNSELGEEERVHADTLVEELRDGVVLIQVIEKLHPEIKSPKYNTSPKTEVEKLDNATVALKLAEAAGIHAAFINPANIVEGDEPAVMGILWELVKELRVKKALTQAAVLDGEVLKQAGKKGEQVPQELTTIYALDQTKATKVSSSSWQASLLRWIRARCAPYGIEVPSLSAINGPILLCVARSLEPELAAKIPYSLDDVKLTTAYMMDWFQQHLKVPKIDLSSVGNKFNERATAVYMSSILLYIPLRYKHLEKGIQKAMELLRKLKRRTVRIVSRAAKAEQAVLDKVTATATNVKETATAAVTNAKDGVVHQGEALLAGAAARSHQAIDNVAQTIGATIFGHQLRQFDGDHTDEYQRGWSFGAAAALMAAMHSDSSSSSSSED